MPEISHGPRSGHNGHRCGPGGPEPHHGGLKSLHQRRSGRSGQQPIVRATRLAVDFRLGLLAAGRSEERVLENYPGHPPENMEGGESVQTPSPSRRDSPSAAAVTRTACSTTASSEGDAPEDSAASNSRTSGCARSRSPERMVIANVADEPAPATDDGAGWIQRGRCANAAATRAESAGRGRCR